MLDIVRYLGRIFACRVNIVAATPKFPVPVFEFQLGKAIVQLQTAFFPSRSPPRWTRHTWAGFPAACGHGPDKPRPPLSLFSSIRTANGVFPDFQPSLSVKHLPPEFWGEHYVVFAVPARMSHCFYCRDAVYRPHRKISWRIFHHRQKASLEPPA